MGGGGGLPNDHLLYKPYRVKVAILGGGGVKNLKKMATWFVNDPLDHFNNKLPEERIIGTATKIKNVRGVVQMYGFHCRLFFIQLVSSFFSSCVILPTAKWSLLCSNFFLRNIAVCAMKQIDSMIM